MQLCKILGDLVQTENCPDIAFTGIAFDSRRVIAGDVFVAIPGTKDNGAIFVQAAIAAGAIAIVAEQPLATPASVPLIRVSSARKALAVLAAACYPKRPRILGAVTGTNGKTSVVHFTRYLWEALGHPSASIGTLGTVTSIPSLNNVPAVPLTTPDAITLYRILDQLAAGGITHTMLEASSHGLDQYRLEGMGAVNIAAFTNLTHEHLDYHGTMEAYFRAKMRLFEELMDTNSVAVVNSDTQEYPVIEGICRHHGRALIAYGYTSPGAEVPHLQFHAITAEGLSQRLEIGWQGKRYTVTIPLVGNFQAYNILCALGAVLGTGHTIEETLPLLAHIPAVPGRMQLVPSASGKCVLVDYAHTPDALEKALSILRPLARNKLVVVFGCGGDRDATKRPMMGEIACRYADRVYLTDDNPRSEKPSEIRQAILQGCTDTQHIVEVGDRKEAIVTAVRHACVDDIVLIAGKGHEKMQIIGDQTFPFDDVMIAMESMKGAA
jgi:UDP-N-acetylmuramoyl-L-alanyl-D-glutamate--2,6-diaminopimelate ligase